MVVSSECCPPNLGLVVSYVCNFVCFRVTLIISVMFLGYLRVICYRKTNMQHPGSPSASISRPEICSKWGRYCTEY